MHLQLVVMVHGILGISWAYFERILSISLAHLGHDLGISWAYHEHILGISWTYLGHILAYLGHILVRVSSQDWLLRSVVNIGCQGCCEDYSICINFWHFLSLYWP